jgi:hypothetical protein
MMDVGAFVALNLPDAIGYRSGRSPMPSSAWAHRWGGAAMSPRASNGTGVA